MIKWSCNLLLKLMGWKYVRLVEPSESSYVMVCAPHTSNWDFFMAMMMAYHVGNKARFLIKSEWMVFPLSVVFKAMGGLAVDRKGIARGEIKSTTDLMAQLFKERDGLVLLVAPEGTRSLTDEWRTGFWHIAHKAKVPLVLAYADYAKKETGVGLIIQPSDLEQDMRAIMNFYRQVTPLKPEKFKLDRNFS